ncbi:MAG: hypothetical protein DIZ80_01370 [endosymbiont of Galathealinum brachiosum]|uniref:Sulfotransferase n=1 Tax=endosymbiont of Galathealinum brachiosum TaxID=2200906 RepID=A0A370DPT1_9GAMM|nr:MAG: hypothetical protein DIZ80_01370 [endosymbiont of Galathealinum brachiosum]
MIQEAFNLLNTGRNEEAKTLLNQLTKTTPNDPQCWYLFGLVKARYQQFDAAEADLLHSLELSVTPQACVALGQVYLGTNKIDKAETYLEKALSLDDTLVEAYNGLATIYASTGKDAQAINYFEKIIDMNVANEFVYGNVALLYERLRKSEQANEAASKAFSLNPNNVPGNLVLARVDRKNKEYDKAIGRLNKILNSPNIHPSVMINIQSELGLNLDLKGDYNQAYRAFLASNEASKQIAKQAPYDKSYYLNKVHNNKMWYSPENVAAFPSVSIGSSNDIYTGRKHPVFFVGFPRSGTTLVEQILSSNSNIETSGEEFGLNYLIDFAKSNIGSSRAYPEFMQDYDTENKIFELRNEYFNKLKTACGFEGGDHLFIDKLPLNIVDLGFINQLFPDAKIIMAYRDPRDVCLSCFMQAFQLNPAMIQFLTLKDTANFYAKTMELWLQYKEVLNIEIFEYKYEDLVEDSESITKNMVSFLGEEWSSEMLEYYKEVATKHVATPSFADVKSPIYSRAVQRWKNYAEEIKQVESVLEPYIKSFGYDV